MSPVSKRIIRAPTQQDVAYKDGKIYYCRACGKILPPDNFWISGDKLLDSNGKISICKNCISKIFQREYIMSGKNVNLATLNTCRIINFVFDEKALESAKEAVEKTNASYETGFYGIAGKLFSQCYESPNKGTLYGMAAVQNMKNLNIKIKSVEGFDIPIEKEYSLENFVSEFGYGIKSAGTYIGAKNLKEFSEKGMFIEVGDSSIKKNIYH